MTPEAIGQLEQPCILHPRIAKKRSDQIPAGISALFGRRLPPI
ncbi:hypothetical protein [Enterococcus florum]|nr:hypothetical protein [Enterococcus florum]